jgi:hypothetical protein
VGRKSSPPRPDLQYLILGTKEEGLDDLPLEVGIDQEVLA